MGERGQAGIASYLSGAFEDNCGTDLSFCSASLRSCFNCSSEKSLSSATDGERLCTLYLSDVDNSIMSVVTRNIV